MRGRLGPIVPRPFVSLSWPIPSSPLLARAQLSPSVSACNPLPSLIFALAAVLVASTRMWTPVLPRHQDRRRRLLPFSDWSLLCCATVLVARFGIADGLRYACTFSSTIEFDHRGTSFKILQHCIKTNGCCLGCLYLYSSNARSKMSSNEVPDSQQLKTLLYTPQNLATLCFTAPHFVSNDLLGLSVVPSGRFSW